jgi:hypothetical protein
MKRVLLIVGIAVGMNTSVALAEHENMPGHANMPDSKKMPEGDHAKHNKKDKKGADSNQSPKPDPNHKKHTQP